MGTLRRSRGFTLFELVVVVCLVAVLAAFAFDRLWAFQEEAERVAAEYNVAALRSALRIRSAELISANKWDDMAKLAQGNPFDLLEDVPATYAGEIREEVVPGNWYYDRKNRSVIYFPRRHTAFLTNGAAQPRMDFQLVGLGADGQVTVEKGTMSVALRPLGQYSWAQRTIR